MPKIDTLLGILIEQCQKLWFTSRISWRFGLERKLRKDLLLTN